METMQTGSFFNSLMAQSTEPAPEVGMGVTILMWTDRHAGTIIEVKGKRVAVQEDQAIRTDGNGMSESQSYVYAANPDAPVEWYSLRKNGKYVRAGDTVWGQTLLIGVKRKYHDFSF